MILCAASSSIPNATSVSSIIPALIGQYNQPSVILTALVLSVRVHERYCLIHSNLCLFISTPLLPRPAIAAQKKGGNQHSTKNVWFPSPKASLRIMEEDFSCNGSLIFLRSSVTQRWSDDMSQEHCKPDKSQILGLPMLGFHNRSNPRCCSDPMASIS